MVSVQLLLPSAEQPARKRVVRRAGGTGFTAGRRSVCSVTGLDSLWIWPVWAVCSFEGRGIASGPPLDVLEKDQQVLICLLHTKGLKMEIGPVVIPSLSLYERGV